jgi:TolA-binding protein
MSIVDLHPEELIDKHASGTLSAAERTRLEAHVQGCAVCRFELAARHDFATLSLPAVQAPSAPPALEPSPRVLPRRRRRGIVLGLAAALIGGVSLAALSASLLGPARPATESAPDRHPAPGRSSPRATTTVAATATPIESPAPAAIADSAGAALEQRARREASQRAPGPPHARASAADLFRAANAARRDRDTTRAVALYRELESRYPRSEEARVSYATLGTLLLDRGDAHAALDGFDQYLSRGDSALGEEALVGRALAFEKLGNHDGEIAAWREVLRRFPGSVHARVARARLLALGER